MFKDCYIKNYYDEKGLYRVAKNLFSMNHTRNWPEGNPRIWKIKSSNEISLFWEWYVSRHGKIILSGYNLKDINSSQYGVDLKKYQKADEEKIIQRLK